MIICNLSLSPASNGPLSPPAEGLSNSLIKPLRVLWFLIPLTLCVLFYAATGFAASVTLAWDANSEPDLAGYNIHWGRSSGNYSFTVDVGNNTTYTFTGLDEGVTYYFAATAYNTNNLRSGYSNQVVYTVPVSDTGGGGVETEAYLQDAHGMVSMETEHFDVNDSSDGYEWTLDYTSGHSGTGAMKAPASSYMTDYVQNSPRLDYFVDFSFSGTHYLWVRAYAAGTGSNSLHAGLNGGTAAGGADFHFDALGSFVWARTTLAIPSAGVHTVNLWVREKSAVIDKVVLTTSASYTPVGFGPAESPRGY
jgi:hypothetical protein